MSEQLPRPYPGNLLADCAAVQPKNNLSAKIKKALSFCIECDAIYGVGDSGAWNQDFSIGGEQTFIDALIPTLSADEKLDLLNEYVLTWEAAQVSELCDSLMTERLNPLRIPTKEAARRILENHFDFVSDELRRMERAA